MSMPATRIDSSNLGETIQFEDFEISWAGANPFGDGYCFGSDDGRFRIMTAEGLATQPKKVTISDESVNSIAFAGPGRRFMAVSTRCEVVVNDLDPRFSKDGPYIYNGGAHGVIATSAGGFVAPLGVNGLLRVPEIGDTEARFLVNTIGDKRINLYQLALLHGDGSRDFIAAAARKDGIHTFDLNSEIDNGRPGSSVFYKVPGLDIVSLCSLDSPDWPYSLAALGTDGSIHLFRDIQAREQPMSLRLEDMLGSPYTILHLKGHLFILTNKAFYSCPNLAEQFLDDRIGHTRERVRKEEFGAVDVYAVDDEILIEMADHLLIAKVDTLISGSGPLGDVSSNGLMLESINNQGTFSSAQIAAFSPTL
jgi:WD40 repeat protein